MTILLHLILVAGGAFVAIAVLASYLKYERLVQAARGRATAELAPRDAFLVTIAQRLALGSRGATPFCVVVLARSADAEPAPEWLERLAAAVRTTDQATPLEEGRVGLLVAAEAPRVPEVLARARAATGGDSAARPCAGVAVFPAASAETAQGLLEAAEQALDAAVAKGPGTRVFEPAAAAEAGPADRGIVAEAGLIDPVSGLLRPERMGGATRKFIASTRKRGRPVSVVYLDVDKLEDFNERYGREVGDAILKRIGQMLHLGVRESDLIGRLGDDDFLAVLECPPPGAVTAAERLIGQLQSAAVEAGLARVHPALHIGVAGYPDHGNSPGALMEAAEAACLEARRQGPNRVILYRPEMGQRARAERETRDVF